MGEHVPDRLGEFAGDLDARDLLAALLAQALITSAYLQGIDSAEIIETVHARRAPMIPVSASLRL
jgi:hypothetical protein